MIKNSRFFLTFCLFSIIIWHFRIRTTQLWNMYYSLRRSTAQLWEMHYSLHRNASQLRNIHYSLHIDATLICNMHCELRRNNTHLWNMHYSLRRNSTLLCNIYYWLPYGRNTAHITHYTETLLTFKNWIAHIVTAGENTPHLWNIHYSLNRSTTLLWNMA